MIKLICFDLWGTLAQEPYRLDDYWVEALEKYPQMINAQKIRGLVDEIAMKKPSLIKEAVVEILSCCGIKDEAVADRVVRRWQFSCDNVRLFDDVIPTLNWLKEKKYLLGLITNTSSYGWSQVEEKYQISAYFDFTAKSFELGMIKPEAGIFSCIESQAKINSEEILMVGDSYESDVLATNLNGWNAIQLIREPKKQNEGFKYIRTLGEIKKILD